MYNVKAAERSGLTTLLTFGGAFSNHIAATAAAGKLLSLNTIGIIRGDEGFENDTLIRAKENGMQLHFISREKYKQKTAPSFIDDLQEQFRNFYLIPEGGANENGVKGTEEILKEIDQTFDFITVSAGTGTTASGLCRSLKNQELIVFPDLKGGGFILEEMSNYCAPEQLKKVQLQRDYHFGGYGKTKPTLTDFMQSFYSEHNVELDKVYTSKMMFGLFDLIKKGTRILAIHTGGLQGN